MHACIYGGCYRSRVVTFTVIRLQGPGFKPRPGQKFENENFCFKCIPAVVKACHPPCRVTLIKTSPDFLFLSEYTSMYASIYISTYV